MRYDYICPNCGNKQTIIKPLSDVNNEESCEKCGSVLRRDWKSSIQVSESNKSENIEQMDWVKQRMKNRPSGKTQVYY